MELDDFESLISRMERLARDRPTRYGRRVFWLASLGYAYLLLLDRRLSIPDILYA